MNIENGISEELNSMESFLGVLSRAMPYSVPNGYFENFAEQVDETIKKIDEAELAPGWDKAMPYSVPAKYVEELAEHIPATARISGLTKEIALTAPVGYFDALPAQMLHAAKNAGAGKKKAVLIPLSRPGIYRQLRWAAAAVMLLSIGVGAYMTFFTIPASPERILASVAGNDIQDYIEHTYRLDVKRIVNGNDINNIPVDNCDIIQYLDETGWDIAD